MKSKGVSRRNLMFGVGGFVTGGAVTGVVGFRFRDEVRKILGVSRPNISQLGLAAADVDEWLLTKKDRAELGGLTAENTTTN